MGRVFLAFRDDDGLRVAILRAEGEKFFCPGWDLKAAAAGDAVDGDYDVASGLLDMQGVISPIYIINSIGSVLTRKGEGVIGFNYALKGSAQAPTVSVNPLSALAPVGLRDIFSTPSVTRNDPTAEPPARVPAPRADR